MNVSKKIGLLSVAGAMAFSFSLFGCGNNIIVEPTPDEIDTAAEESIDYTSYTGGTAAFFVENQSTEKLVAFKGDLDKDYMIGGIPASAKVHGLKRTKVLEKTGDFPLILITENEYRTNIKNLKNAVPFATIYAFVNASASNNSVFKISAKSGGTGRIVIRNVSNWNIEVRKDGPDGEVLGYALAGSTNTVIRVNAPDDYTLFPIFKKFTDSELTGPEIYESVPKFKSGTFEGQAFAEIVALPKKDSEFTWDLGPLAASTNMDLSSGGVFIVIQNNNGSAIRFMRGGEEQMTSLGIKGIPASTGTLFSIKAPRAADGKYPNSIVIGGLKITTAMGNEQLIPDQTYDLDYTYTVYAQGRNASDLTLMTAEDRIATLPLEERAQYSETNWIENNAKIFFANNEDRTENEIATAKAEYQKWLKKVMVEKGKKLDLDKIFNM